MHDTLVISGGSIKGFGLLGAIQKIYEYYESKEEKIKTFNCFVGTSVGSIIGYLLAIGYEPLEIIHSIHSSAVLEKLRRIELIQIMNNKGLFFFEPIIEELENLTLKKRNKLYTLQELSDDLGKEFICVTFNYTKNKVEYLNRNDYPNLPCLVAVRMSSSIPFVFNRFTWGDSIYIDGGISDNFPIQVARRFGKENLIGVVCKETGEDTSNDNNSLINFIMVMLFFPIVNNTQRTIKKYRKRYPIIQVPLNYNFLKFSLSVTDIMEMFSSGYNSITHEQMSIILNREN